MTRDLTTLPARLLVLLALVLGLAVSATDTAAQPFGFGENTPKAPATLIADTQSLQPGQRVTLALHYEIEYPFHAYWSNPEGSAYPPRIVWDLPEGYQISEPRWPSPQTFLFSGKTQFGYEHEMTLLFDLAVPDDAAPGGELTISADLDTLVCGENTCNPELATVSLTLPVAAGAPEPSEDAELIEAAQQRVPRAAPEGWSFAGQATDDGYALIITAPSEEAAAALEGLFYYHDQMFAHDPGNQGEPQVDGNTIRIALPNYTVDPSPYDGIDLADVEPLPRLTGALVSTSGFGDAAVTAVLIDTAVGGVDADAITEGARQSAADESDESAAAGSETEIGFFVAIGLALVGGLILNLMPCVFPVLSIKILGFVQQAGENPAIVRRHGYAFAAGVLVSFWVLVGVLLALRAAAEAAGGDASSVTWAFQLQNPTFMLIMVVLVFLVGLNLIGAFEIGFGLSAMAGRASQNVQKEGYGNSLFTGVLATLIATPCTGPLMAPALGAAIQMSTVQAFIVFTALGVGMAAPYVILSCFPKLLDYLPRPGAWMESFKQAMAFPMFATAGVGVWIYAGLTDDLMVVVLLSALTVIALGAWVYGRWAGITRSARTKWIARAVALIAIAGAIIVSDMTARSIEQARQDKLLAIETGEYVIDWQAYSPANVEALRETGRPVLIDFTARWCAICQTNKLTTLRTDSADALYERYNVALVEADYTRKDPQIGRVLADYDRLGVPLYLVFPADGGEPEVLPETLTPSILQAAIERAAGDADATASAAP